MNFFHFFKPVPTPDPPPNPMKAKIDALNAREAVLDAEVAALGKKIQEIPTPPTQPTPPKG